MLGVCYGAQYLVATIRRRGKTIGHKGIRTRDTIESRCEQPADRRPFGQDASMDVAWRYDREDSGKLPHHRQHGHRSGRRLPDRRRTDLGHPVSPGSVPFDRRQTTAETFRRGYLRLPPTVDARLVHRIDRPRTARQDQRRQGIAGTLRRASIRRWRPNCCTKR